MFCLNGWVLFLFSGYVSFEFYCKIFVIFCSPVNDLKMAKLTEEMVHARTRQSNLSTVSKLNCW